MSAVARYSVQGTSMTLPVTLSYSSRSATYRVELPGLNGREFLALEIPLNELVGAAEGVEIIRRGGPVATPGDALAGVGSRTGR